MLDKVVMRYLCRCVKLGKGGKQVENSKTRALWIHIWGKAVPEFSGSHKSVGTHKLFA